MAESEDTLSTPPQEFPPEIVNLLTCIANRNYTIGIFDLGYVGLPLALTAFQHGFDVSSFDVDGARIADLHNDRSGIEHIDEKVTEAAVSARNFRATDCFSELDNPGAILIAVPTPLSNQRESELVYFRAEHRRDRPLHAKGTAHLSGIDHMASDTEETCPTDP